MYQITESLFQGGRPKALPSEINAVVSLLLPGNENIPIFTIDAHIWLPMEDGPFPGIEWLEMAVGIIESLEKANKKIYVHCREGVSRSVMLVAAYLIKTNCWTVDKALEKIAETNKVLNPNPRFIMGLKDYHKYLYKD